MATGRMLAGRVPLASSCMRRWTAKIGYANWFIYQRCVTTDTACLPTHCYQTFYADPSAMTRAAGGLRRASSSSSCCTGGITRLRPGALTSPDVPLHSLPPPSTVCPPRMLLCPGMSIPSRSQHWHTSPSGESSSLRRPPLIRAGRRRGGEEGGVAWQHGA